MASRTLNGVSITYEDSGSGEPLLLVHGLGSSGLDWKYVAPELAAHRRVIVPDVRGHGRSGKPAGAYGVPLFAADLAALCDELKLTSVHVAGLSMGGMIGFQLAVDRPDLVRSLTIINSGPDMIPRNLKTRAALGARVLLLRLFGPQTLAKVLAPKIFPKPEQAELRERLVASISANDPSAYLRSTKALIGWSVLDRLGEITCPALILSSDRDYTPLAAKQAYVARMKHARLQEIHDSGHAATWDQPRAVIEAIEPFLESAEGAFRRGAAG
jgi:3-oxoadipate enol-lactonase